MGNKRKDKIICPECGGILRKIMMRIEDTPGKILSLQCSKRECGYISFDRESANHMIEDIKQQLSIEQNVIKLSQDRLGIYFGKDIVRSTGLKGGEKVHISIPDKKHIMLEIIS